jgi:hypothetical protein
LPAGHSGSGSAILEDDTAGGDLDE